MGFFGVCSGGAECSHLNAMVTNAASKPSVCFISLWRGDSRETRLSSVLGAASRWEGFGWMPVGATRRQGSDGLDFGRRLECFPGSQHLRWCSLRIAVAFFFFLFSWQHRAGDSGSLCTAQGGLVTGDWVSCGLRQKNCVRA